MEREIEREIEIETVTEASRDRGKQRGSETLSPSKTQGCVISRDYYSIRVLYIGFVPGPPVPE